jgi:hypothetical protein
LAPRTVTRIASLYKKYTDIYTENKMKFGLKNYKNQVKEEDLGKNQIDLETRHTQHRKRKTEDKIKATKWKY